MLPCDKRKLKASWINCSPGSKLTLHIVVDGIKDPIEDPDVVNYVE